MNQQYTPLGSLQGENSYTYFLKFSVAAQANDRVYLAMDSAIDAAKIVGIETHVHIPFLNYDFGPIVQIDGITYNVITFAELRAMTLTLVDKTRRQCLSQYPFTGLYNAPAAFSIPQKAKQFRKFDLDILSGESYVTFNFASTVAAPFVAPITFYFNDKK
jgi:hypothetical protein